MRKFSGADSCSYHVEHAPGDQIRIFGLRQFGGEVFERQFIFKFVDTGDGIVGDDTAFARMKTLSQIFSTTSRTFEL